MRDTPYFEQVRLLSRYLPALSAAECFALKGGTAINLFVRDMPRLSVDIDLAYLPLATRDAALAEIRARLAETAERARRLIPGLQVRDAGSEEAPRQLAVADGARIKIEPNPVLRGSVFPPEMRALAPAAEDMFELSIATRVLSRSDLYAGKLCAALDRQHPRDWFDVHLLLKDGEFDEPLRQAFVVYLASHPRPMAELLDPKPKPLRDVFDREFAGMARDAVAVEALESTQARVPKMLRDSLAENERRFLLSIKRGEPDWTLLPIPHLSELPALRWKLANIATLKRMAERHRSSVDALRAVLEL